MGRRERRSRRVSVERVPWSAVQVRTWTAFEALANHTVCWRACRRHNPELAGLIWREMGECARRCIELGRDPVELAQRLGLGPGEMLDLLGLR